MSDTEYDPASVPDGIDLSLTNFELLLNLVLTCCVFCMCFLPFTYFAAGDSAIKELEKQNKEYKYTKIDQLIWNYASLVCFYSFVDSVTLIFGSGSLSSLFVFLCNIITIIIMSQLYSIKNKKLINALRVLSGILSFSTSLMKGSPMGDLRNWLNDEVRKYLIKDLKEGTAYLVERDGKTFIQRKLGLKG